MNVKYCYRCGKTYPAEDYKSGNYMICSIAASYGENVDVREVSVCPECMKSFKEWMEGHNMTACKCDRCGKLFEPQRSPEETLISIRKWKSAIGWNDQDLCDDCYNELVSWWNGKSTVPKEEPDGTGQ